MPMSYKTTNDLMQHLRDNGIAISGETPVSYTHLTLPTKLEV